MTKYRARTYDKTDGMMYDYYCDANERANQLEQMYGGCWMVEEVPEYNNNSSSNDCSYSSSSSGGFIETIFKWIILIAILSAMFGK